MAKELFSRNALYWGDDKQQELLQKHVAVFGLGGVGGFCAEALARAGVGNLTIIDFDTVSESNINRQIIALSSAIGQKKTDLFEKRLKDINPEINLTIIDDFWQGTSSFYKENAPTLVVEGTASLDKGRGTTLVVEGTASLDKGRGTTLVVEGLDFVADAIDTMRSKIYLLKFCYENDIPVISSMGAGNRIDPTQLYIADLKNVENRNAPFVSNVIYQLKKLGITEGIPFVCSRETPKVQRKITEKEEIYTKSGEKIEFNKIVPSSTPFVASCSGIFMASYIVQKLIEV